MQAWPSCHVVARAFGRPGCAEGALGVYLAPGRHSPLVAGFRVTAPARWGRRACQELTLKRPQAPVVPAVHTPNLPGLEAPAAVPGALDREGEKRGDLSRRWQAFGADPTRHCQVPGLQSGSGIRPSSRAVFAVFLPARRGQRGPHAGDSEAGAQRLAGKPEGLRSGGTHVSGALSDKSQNHPGPRVLRLPLGRVPVALQGCREHYRHGWGAWQRLRGTCSLGCRCSLHPPLPQDSHKNLLSPRLCNRLIRRYHFQQHRKQWDCPMSNGPSGQPAL